MSHNQEIQGKLKKGHEFKKRTRNLAISSGAIA